MGQVKVSGITLALLLLWIAAEPGVRAGSTSGPSDDGPAQAYSPQAKPTQDEAVPWDIVVEPAFSFRLTTPGPFSGTAVLTSFLYLIIFLVGIYTLRHYGFTLNRLFGRQRHPYALLDTTDWPPVTVLIAAHNEETVIASILEALLRADYPAHRLCIMPVNDRSTDRTREIIDTYVEMAARRGKQIRPFHRTSGKPGKAAALQDAFERVETELTLIFDADYVPGSNLVRQLVAPFLDPEVGAVMGRVVPVNTRSNLLTRLLDLERSGGYQVDQQARMNLRLIPQYGGTVGGVRRRALDSVGGWREDSLAEDTDLTCRLSLAGWKVAYSNRYECYEEVPETWPVRIRQVRRWAKGHTDAALRYGPAVLTSRTLRWRERLDGLLLLGIYLMAPLLLLGWAGTLALFYLGTHALHGLVAVLAVASFSTFGNFAAFYEIAAAVRLDGSRERARLLPFVLVGFLVSLVSVSAAALSQLDPRARRQPLVWDKTERFRGRTQTPAADRPAVPGAPPRRTPRWRRRSVPPGSAPN